MRKIIRQTIIAAFLGSCSFGVSWAQVQRSPISVATAISLQKNFVSQHEPVIIEMSFENLSPRGIVVNLGSQDEKVRIRVVGPDGRILRRPHLVHNGWESADVFYVAGSATTIGSVVLSEWFNFEKTGKYRIEVEVAPHSYSQEPFSYHLQNSQATLTLTVLPRDEASLRSACAHLLAGMRDMPTSPITLTAAQALSRVNDPVAVPFLAEGMKAKGFERLMIDALVRLGTEDAINAIVAASHSSDPETRTLASAALVGLGPKGKN
jgi:hypothetical protein